MQHYRCICLSHDHNSYAIIIWALCFSWVFFDPHADATVGFAESAVNITEGEVLEVCLELSNVPPGGVACDITVMLAAQPSLYGKQGTEKIVTHINVICTAKFYNAREKNYNFNFCAISGRALSLTTLRYIHYEKSQNTSFLVLARSCILLAQTTVIQYVISLLKLMFWQFHTSSFALFMQLWKAVTSQFWWMS